MANKADTNTMEAIPSPMLPQVARVRRVVKETHDCFSLVFDSPTGEPFQFEPGQFNMLYAFGVGEVPISISSAPSQKEPLCHTIRAVGAVTKALQKLKKGDEVGIRGPFGSAWPLDFAAGRDVVVIAGGIGLSPLRPAICQILAQRDRFGQVSIVYGARTPEEIVHQKDLEKWSARLDSSVLVTVDYTEGHWHGNVGVVTQLIPKAPCNPENTCALICGPEIMMRFSVRELVRQGVSEENIFVSMERNMKCALGFCGHCQYGPHFVCKDGPVFRYSQIKPLVRKSEI
jgi:NAD(P)H-flavin reductase